MNLIINLLGREYRDSHDHKPLRTSRYWKSLFVSASVERICCSLRMRTERIMIDHAEDAFVYNTYWESMSGTGPTTKEELRQSLDRTVRKASKNGVDVEEETFQLLYDAPNIPDLEIMLVSLQS